MSTNDDSIGVVIVAIPSPDDYVWKISSEKIPHMTLLFLGAMTDPATQGRVAQFLQHVADTSIPRFGMGVDHRGSLGPDEADVLFFDKSFSYKQMADARSFLLQNEDIFTAYNSTEQYEGWTPHLTLGYPATPAHPDNRDYPGITWVNFDRVALWVGDFDGPTFQLESRNDLAMSDNDEVDALVADILHHYDTEERGLMHMAETVSNKPWSNFKPSDYTDQQWLKACLLDRGAKMGSAKQRASLPIREPDGTLNKNGCSAAAAVLSSVGGTGKARGHALIGVKPSLVANAKSKLAAIYKTILKQDVPEGLQSQEAKHSDEAVEDFLKHHGVKGQKWGVRRTRAELSGATTRLKDAYADRKRQIGEDRALSISKDAEAAKTSLRIARNASTDKLSNPELQHLVSRMNLEKQYSQLTGEKNQLLEKRVSKVLLGAATEKLTGSKDDSYTKVVGKALKSEFSKPKNTSGKKKK